MPFDTQILTDKIEGIKTAFQNGRFADALVASLNTGSGIMQQRIFQDNEDINGNGFGQYIGKKRKARLQVSLNKTQNKRNQNIAGLYLTSYQRKRARAGRQIAKKDLEFTGGLRRAIETVVESETAAVLEFNNSDAAIIAHGQEAQLTRIKSVAMRIFTLNKTEKEQVNEQALLLIKQILKPK